TYVWVTVTTSSSAPTPTPRRARWSAVVQLDTAQACGVPTAAANSSSKAATSGPCVTQPDRIARRAASASASPSSGRAIGISGSAPLGNDRLPCPTPPGDEVAQPLLEADPGLEAEQPPCVLDIRQPAPDSGGLPRGTVLNADV